MGFGRKNRVFEKIIFCILWLYSHNFWGSSFYFCTSAPICYINMPILNNILSYGLWSACYFSFTIYSWSRSYCYLYDTTIPCTFLWNPGIVYVLFSRYRRKVCSSLSCFQYLVFLLFFSSLTFWLIFFLLFYLK